MASFTSGIFQAGLICVLLSAFSSQAEPDTKHSFQEGPFINIPSGGPITLDGTLSPEEWVSSARYAFSGSEVFLQNEGDVVSIGVRGSQAGFPHLALSAGDSVWVLHASAALGKVVYASGSDGWALVTPPVWEVRDPSLTAAAEKVRADYIEANGWVGTTGHMGQPGETEFLIRLDRFGPGEVRFAVAHLAPETPEQTTRWPEANPDDVGLLQLLTGPMPEKLDLVPSQWALLLISEGRS